MKKSVWFGVCVVLGLAGCGTSDGDGVDASSGDGGRDAVTTAVCEDTSGLEVGRCIDANTGRDCFGVPGEAEVFERVPAGSPLPFIRGPQGSSMFVLAVRAEGIDPGDLEQPFGPTSPTVEIVLTADDGERMSLLRRRAAFVADPDNGDAFYRSAFFAIIDGPCPSGRSMTASVSLTDQNGLQRCGTLTFAPDCS